MRTQKVSKPERSALRVSTWPAMEFDWRNSVAAFAIPGAFFCVLSPSIVEPAPDQHDAAAPASRSV